MEQPTFTECRRSALEYLRAAREWLAVDCEVTEEQASAMREAAALITRARVLLSPPS